MSDSSVHERLEQLRGSGVRYLRILYPDLHGIARGKLLPLGELDHAVEHGVAFATGIMYTDLAHQYLGAPDPGIPDFRAVPALDTLMIPRWEPDTAWCLCDLYDFQNGGRYRLDPRAVLAAIVERYRARGLVPLVGPELEFYLLVPNGSGSFDRYFQSLSPVYTTGPLSDPRGFTRTLLERVEALGLEPRSVFCEFGRGQYEVNLNHGSALEAADHTFLYKLIVKETAATCGFHATFIGKPWNDDEGSGFHLHLSCVDDQGRNLFADPASEDRLSELAKQFMAGVLAHIPGIMAFLNPTINAYRRINARGLCPRYANWGYDNRFALVRVPPERGDATRLEIRIGDGAANPYLAIAAVLAAGLEGIERGLQPPAPIDGFPDELPEGLRGAPIPTRLDQACCALESDQVLQAALGSELVAAYLQLKNSELERFARWVSEWERREYVPWL